jgi:hypothetical protein
LNIPHTYVYGNWRVKVPIILQKEGIERHCHNPRSSSEIQKKR